MGYTIKTRRYRYTLWLPFNHNTEKADWNITIAEELYNQEMDMEENSNVCSKEEYFQIKAELKRQLKYGWREALPRHYKRVNKQIR